jgi:hypothetical protein
MKPPCVVKPLHLCSPKATRSRKRRRDSCFHNLNGYATNNKLAQTPGTVHIATIITTGGICQNFDSISGATASLTLPTGFSFLTTGKSPNAHIFVGSAGSSFDLHDGTPLTEVTGMPGVTQSISGQTLTVSLSGLDLGSGPGVIPAADTIFIRAHASYTGPGAAASDSSFVFSTSATATLPGGIGTVTNNSTATIIGNPTAGCTADGTF